VPETTPSATRWLTLHEASTRLDIHPATLRDWADRGRVRTYRTPGGHRRFAEEDVNALAARSAPELDLFMSATVGQARLAASAGRLASEPWYSRFDEAAKVRQRELGMDLVRVLIGYLGDTEKGWTEEVHELGERYAKLAGDVGLSLGESLRAFHIFEGVVRSSVEQLSAAQAGGAQLERPVSWFLNEVRIAMAESLNQPRS
jgi:excisionase family DNA binding protein